MPTTFYSKRYIDWPPIAIASYADPNSSYWQSEAEFAAARFDQAASEFWTKAGWEKFNALVLAHYGDAMTWKQAHDCYRAAAENIAEGTTVESLAYAVGVLPE